MFTFTCFCVSTAAIEGRHKFHDPSQTIYMDSLHKKQQQQMNGGHFLLSGLNGVASPPPPQTLVGNGHIPQYGQPNGSVPNHMNINVNPMEERQEIGMSDAESRRTDVSNRQWSFKIKCINIHYLSYLSTNNLHSLKTVQSTIQSC